MGESSNQPHRKEDNSPENELGIGGNVSDSVVVQGDGNVIQVGNSKPPIDEEKLKKLESQAIRFELSGDLHNARRAWYEIRRIDPMYPRVDLKIKELEKELAPKRTSMYSTRSWASVALLFFFLLIMFIPLKNWTTPATPADTTPTIFVKTPSISTPFISSPTPAISSIMISEKDGMTLVYVPTGEFVMGSNNIAEDAQPSHTIYLESFWIDRTEVTNAMYKRCVEAGICAPPSNIDFYSNPEFKDNPVVYVDWYQAKTYCEWRGDRLPTEAEWEKAARGTDGRLYPWGDNTIDCKKSNYAGCFGGSSQVGSLFEGVSVYGLFDMAGNVWEWINDWYDETYYQYSPSNNPLGPESGTLRSLRGGSWRDLGFYVQVSNRGRNLPNTVDNNIGFRCAKSVP